MSFSVEADARSLGASVTRLKEALAHVTKPGSMVAVGGMMLYRRPVAACMAIADLGTPLSVVTFSAGYETEVIAASGNLVELRTCYAGLEIFGPSPVLRKVIEAGTTKFVDETELTLAAGLQAAILDLPWMPVAHSIVGTDFETVRSDIIVVGEHNREPLLGLPAIAPDVCLVHVPFADAEGNALLISSPSLDRQMISASTTVILTAEQIVSSERLSELGPLEVYAFEVDHVFEVPGGASPTSCYPHYGYDGIALLEYVEER